MRFMGFSEEVPSVDTRLKIEDELRFRQGSKALAVDRELLVEIWTVLDEGGVVVVVGTDHPITMASVAAYFASSFAQPVAVIHWAQFGREVDAVPMPALGPVLITLNCPEDIARDEYASLDVQRPAGLFVVLEGRTVRPQVDGV